MATDIFTNVKTLYDDYGIRARELKNDGKTLIGYVCSFVPVEMITASGCIPFRIRGNVNEPITKGDTLLETIVCPFVRSCFDLCVKGKYDFLSGIVIPHACDSITRSYSAWSYSLGLPYSFFLNTPSVIKDSAFTFFNQEMNTFKTSLEKFTGKTITDAALADAIDLHNTYRQKVKELYEFRKGDPPMISGVELTRVLTAGTSLPVEEANTLLDNVIAAVKQRTQSPVKKNPRILIDSACVDNIGLIKIIEDLGANVVIDTMCNGTRDHFPQVKTGGDPINALSYRYLNDVNCPKTYRENTAGTFKGDAQNRFSEIGQYSKDFKADGVILYVYKYCDPFGFEVPARKAYYSSLNIPHIYLEDEYSAGTIGQLKTRIQAFLEMIE